MPPPGAGAEAPRPRRIIMQRLVANRFDPTALKWSLNWRLTTHNFTQILSPGLLAATALCCLNVSTLALSPVVDQVIAVDFHTARKYGGVHAATPGGRAGRPE